MNYASTLRIPQKEMNTFDYNFLGNSMKHICRHILFAPFVQPRLDGKVIRIEWQSM